MIFNFYKIKLLASLSIFSLSACAATNGSCTNSEVYFSCDSPKIHAELCKDETQQFLITLNESSTKSKVALSGEADNLFSKSSYHRFKVTDHVVTFDNNGNKVELYDHFSEETGETFRELGVIVYGDTPITYKCAENSSSKLAELSNTQ